MPRDPRTLEDILLEFLSRRGLGPHSRLAIAYSGGPDSSALLVAVRSAGVKAPVAVYVDHGIRDREEMEAEITLVKSTCSLLEVPLFSAHVRRGAVEELSSSKGIGVEAAARLFRFAAFREALARTKTDVMLLAHTKDDQLETILMRMLGGSGAGGIKGMPDASGMFLRPLLGVEKGYLRAYLAERQIAYFSDSSNGSAQFLRNRIRREIVPILDQSFTGWRKGLLRSAEKAELDESALGSAAEELGFAPFGEPRSLSVPASALRGAPKAVATRAIIRAAGKLLKRERFSFRMAVEALRTFEKDGSSYKGADLELFERDGRAILRRGLDFPRHDGYFVLIDRPRQVRVGPLFVSASWSAGASNGIRADAFRFPLVIRSRRPGDAIALKGGTKRLDVLFSEWALTEGARDSTPVVEDRDGIVAVLGAGLGGRDRFRDRSESNGSEGGRPLGVSSEAGRTRSLKVIVKGA